MKRIMSLLLTVLISFSALLYLPKETTAYASSDVILQYDSNIISQVGQQASRDPVRGSSVSCACFALAYCRSILDGYAHSWYEYDGIGNGDQWNTECAWGNGNYKMAWAPNQLSLYQTIYDQINNGRPTVIHVDGHNNPRSSYHWVAIVGYRGSANRNSLSANDFFMLDPGYSPIFDNLGSVGYEPKWEDHSLGSGYAYRYTDTGAVSSQGQQSITPPQPNVGKPVVSVNSSDSEHPVTISYNACDNATHYDIRFYNTNDTLVWALGCCDDGAAFNNLVQYTDTSYSHTFPVGSYYVNVAAVNIDTGKYAFSDKVSFSVTEPPVPQTQAYFKVGNENNGEIPITLSIEHIHGTINALRVYYPKEQFTPVGIRKDYINEEEGIIVFVLGISGYTTYNDNDIYSTTFKLSRNLNAPTGKYVLNAELVDYTDTKTTVSYIVKEGEIFVAPTQIGGTLGNGVRWKIENNALDISGNGKLESNVPWALYKSEIKTIIIHDGITSIGDRVFSGYTGLTSITLPDSVTSIGYNAFSGCTGLTSITLPDSVTSIGNYAFSGCTGLTSIIIPDSVTSIGYNAFSGCTELTSVTIPDSVTTIGSSAFSGCTGLTSITIPDSIMTIENDTFSGCIGLTSITIPDSVTYIGSSSFKNCTRLSDVNIPESVTKFGKNTFENTPWLQSKQIENCLVIINGNLIDGNTCKGSITIPNSVQHICNSAFSKCIEPIDVIIPDSLTTIDGYAFSGCTGLTSITLPDSVTSIGGYAFSGCTGLKNITIPDSVTSIETNAFSGCAGLTSIIIPDGVTSIGNNAFSGCTGLTSITIPDSVASIGGSAFQGCINLASVEMPGSIMDVSVNAFDNTPWLETLKDKNGLIIIGNTLVSGKSCTGDIVIPNNVKTISSFAFSGCTGLTSIIIPDSVTFLGKSAFSGCAELGEVTISNNLSLIPREAFYNCNRIKSISIPDSVTEIGFDAFYNCVNLDSLHIGSGLSDISNIRQEIHALYYSNRAKLTLSSSNPFFILENDIIYSNDKRKLIICAGYKSGALEIPKSVVEIGASAFDSCPRLTGITIPESVTSIGARAFSGCKQLKSIVLPKSMSKIAGGTFSNCTSLENITLPNNITEIEYDAFWGCLSLKSITIPDSVTSIGDAAFCGCSKLTSVTLPINVTKIGGSAFHRCNSLDIITILNPNCEIWDTKLTISNSDTSDPNSTVFNGTIKAYENSTAQKFASKYDYKFESLGKAPEIITTTTTTTTTQTTTLTTSTTPKPTTTTIITTTTMPKSTTTTTQSTTTTTATTKPILKIDKTSVTMTNGDQYTIIANRNDVTYKSNNLDVAIVSSNGVITAVGVGQATITAFDSDSNVVQIKVEVGAITTTTIVQTTMMTSTTPKPTATTNTTNATTTTEQTTTVTTEPPVSDSMLGDVNGDKEISVEDAQLTLNAYVKIMAGMDSGLTDQQAKAANVNKDSEVSVDDAQTILLYYVRNTLSGTTTTWDELLGKATPASPRPPKVLTRFLRLNIA